MTIRPFIALLLSASVVLATPETSVSPETVESPAVRIDAHTTAAPALSLTPQQDPTPKPDSGNLSSLLGGDRPKDATTEITADEEASFDNANNVAIFRGNVIVRDPQFDLQCDTLRVTLNSNRRGLAKVEAEGNVIIVRETQGENGAPVRSEGRAKKVVYDADTGRATLTGWPQIRHGLNTQVATEEGTVMVLDRNGKSTTTGRSRTIVGETRGN